MRPDEQETNPLNNTKEENTELLWEVMRKLTKEGYKDTAQDKENIKQLITNGANVNAVDNLRNTPLHYAAFYGKADIAKLLIDNNAIVNAQDVNGNTPLHYAAFHGKSDIVKLLINNKADVNAQDKYDYTPLHRIVSQFGQEGRDAAQDKETIEQLIAAGADVNAQDVNGNTPLHDAVSQFGQEGRDTAIDQQIIDQQIIEQLIAAGADTEAKNGYGNTPLDLAATNPDLQNIINAAIIKKQGEELIIESKILGIKGKTHNSSDTLSIGSSSLNAVDIDLSNLNDLPELPKGVKYVKTKGRDGKPNEMDNVDITEIRYSLQLVTAPNGEKILVTSYHGYADKGDKGDAIRAAEVEHIANVVKSYNDLQTDDDMKATDFILTGDFNQHAYKKNKTTEEFYEADTSLLKSIQDHGLPIQNVATSQPVVKTRGDTTNGGRFNPFNNNQVAKDLEKDFSSTMWVFAGKFDGEAKIIDELKEQFGKYKEPLDLIESQELNGSDHAPATLKYQGLTVTTAGNMPVAEGSKKAPKAMEDVFNIDKVNELSRTRLDKDAGYEVTDADRLETILAQENIAALKLYEILALARVKQIKDGNHDAAIPEGLSNRLVFDDGEVTGLDLGKINGKKGKDLAGFFAEIDKAITVDGKAGKQYGVITEGFKDGPLQDWIKSTEYRKLINLTNDDKQLNLQNPEIYIKQVKESKYGPSRCLIEATELQLAGGYMPKLFGQSFPTAKAISEMQNKDILNRLGESVPTLLIVTEASTQYHKKEKTQSKTPKDYDELKSGLKAMEVEFEERRTKAAITIQAAFRGKFDREVVKEMREEVSQTNSDVSSFLKDIEDKGGAFVKKVKTVDVKPSLHVTPPTPTLITQKQLDNLKTNKEVLARAYVLMTTARIYDHRPSSASFRDFVRAALLTMDEPYILGSNKITVDSSNLPTAAEIKAAATNLSTNKIANKIAKEQLKKLTGKGLVVENPSIVGYKDIVSAGDPTASEILGIYKEGKVPGKKASENSSNNYYLEFSGVNMRGVELDLARDNGFKIDFRGCTMDESSSIIGGKSNLGTSNIYNSSTVIDAIERGRSEGKNKDVNTTLSNDSQAPRVWNKEMSEEFPKVVDQFPSFNPAEITRAAEVATGRASINQMPESRDGGDRGNALPHNISEYKDDIIGLLKGEKSLSEELTIAKIFGDLKFTDGATVGEHYGQLLPMIGKLRDSLMASVENKEKNSDGLKCDVDSNNLPFDEVSQIYTALKSIVSEIGNNISEAAQKSADAAIKATEAAKEAEEKLAAAMKLLEARQGEVNKAEAAAAEAEGDGAGGPVDPEAEQAAAEEELKAAQVAAEAAKAAAEKLQAAAKEAQKAQLEAQAAREKAAAEARAKEKAAADAKAKEEAEAKEKAAAEAKEKAEAKERAAAEARAKEEAEAKEKAKDSAKTTVPGADGGIGGGSDTTSTPSTTMEPGEVKAISEAAKNEGTKNSGGIKPGDIKKARNANSKVVSIFV